MKTTISFFVLIILITGCRKPDRTLQGPHFDTVEITVQREGEPPEIHVPDTSGWIVGTVALDTKGKIQDQEYSLKLIYLGESRIHALPSDRYRVHAEGPVFSAQSGGSIGSDHHVRPFGESGMHIISGKGINVYMKVTNEGHS